jgi:hypothetical protein
MNTFPLALSKKLEGEGERFAGRESWMARGFGMRSRVRGEGMRFAGIDIGGERHAVAVVNENGLLHSSEQGLSLNSELTRQHRVAR